MNRLIVTHIGADIDAVASSLALARLYENSKIFFPGSLNKQSQELLNYLFPNGIKNLITVKELKKLIFNEVVVVDTRQRSRIGIVADLIKDKRVTVFDHHPPAHDDLSYSCGVVDETVGSTSTLVWEFLRGKVELEPQYATLLLAGIYEDTGSLSYLNTSYRDLFAAAELLKIGANLRTVRVYALPRFTKDHLRVLYKIADKLKKIKTGGFEVGIAELYTPEFVEELAPMANMILAILRLDAIFLLIQEPDRVAVIARSRNELFNVGEILNTLGWGGGHSTAAAASLKFASLKEVYNRLVLYLSKFNTYEIKAADIMVSPVYTVEEKRRVYDAYETLRNLNVNSLPVVNSEKKVVGAVTRQIIDKAIKHGLADKPVSSVLNPYVNWVSPNSKLTQVAKEFILNNPRFVLVGEPSKLPMGIITRNMLLKAAVSYFILESEYADRTIGGTVTQTLSEDRLVSLIGSDRLRVLRDVVELAEKEKVSLYMVGGTVRDILLGKKVVDIDLMVEGNALVFAETIKKHLNLEVKLHKPFFTAKIYGSNFVFDLASARTESYKYPASLPEVNLSPLRNDLMRRDFTINALAVKLTGEKRYRIVDFFGGLRDLKNKIIRVLHSLSFIEDPTRIFRAVSLESRLGFKMASDTEKMAKTAVRLDVIKYLSFNRLKRAFWSVVDSLDRVLENLKRLDSLGVSEAIFGFNLYSDRVATNILKVRKVWDWIQIENIKLGNIDVGDIVLKAIALGHDVEKRNKIEKVFMLEKGYFVTLEKRIKNMLWHIGKNGIKRSDIFSTIDSCSKEELLLAFALADDKTKDKIHDYLVNVGKISISIKGKDLIDSGIEEGPIIGEALKAVKDAIINREINSGFEEELKYAINFVKKKGEVDA